MVIGIAVGLALTYRHNELESGAALFAVCYYPPICGMLGTLGGLWVARHTSKPAEPPK
jgi:hypothetical protein